MVRLHRRLPTMELFVKTLGTQAECRKYCLFFHLNQRLQRGQAGMITGHLCRVSSEPCTAVPMPLCCSVCMCVCFSPITLPAAGIPGIKEPSVRWPAEAEDEGGWWVGERQRCAGLADGTDPVSHRNPSPLPSPHIAGEST